MIHPEKIIRLERDDEAVVVEIKRGKDEGEGDHLVLDVLYPDTERNYDPAHATFLIDPHELMAAIQSLYPEA